MNSTARPPGCEVAMASTAEGDRVDARVVQLALDQQVPPGIT
jgi:hypothetical protein